MWLLSSELLGGLQVDIFSRLREKGLLLLGKARDVVRKDEHEGIFLFVASVAASGPPSGGVYHETSLLHVRKETG